MRALVIQHEEDAPGGNVSEWLRARGAQEVTYRITSDGRGDGPDPNPRDYGLVVPESDRLK